MRTLHRFSLLHMLKSNEVFITFFSGNMADTRQTPLWSVGSVGHFGVLHGTSIISSFLFLQQNRKPERCCGRSLRVCARDGFSWNGVEFSDIVLQTVPCFPKNGVTTVSKIDMTATAKQEQKNCAFHDQLPARVHVPLSFPSF